MARSAPVRPKINTQAAQPARERAARPLASGGKAARPAKVSALVGAGIGGGYLASPPRPAGKCHPGTYLPTYLPGGFLVGPHPERVTTGDGRQIGILLKQGSDLVAHPRRANRPCIDEPASAAVLRRGRDDPLPPVQLILGRHSASLRAHQRPTSRARLRGLALVIAWRAPLLSQGSSAAVRRNPSGVMRTSGRSRRSSSWPASGSPGRESGCRRGHEWPLPRP